MFFYWDQWNREHATVHGVTEAEIMFVIRHAARPYPESAGEGKYRIWGAVPTGRLIQVVFTFTSLDRVDYEQLSYDDILHIERGTGPYVYVIHARDLTAAEKRRFHKRRH